MYRAGLPLAVLVILAACEQKAPSAPVTTTDSAGVDIVTSREAVWPEGSGWRVDSAPRVVIGGGVADTTLLVGPVAGAFRLADGRILVADEGADLLRWFGSDGTPLFQAGGKGNGPGEFRSISRLLEVGDSIAVYDSQLRRLSMFGVDGSFSHAITFASTTGSPFPPGPVGHRAGGGWVGVLTSAHTTGEPSGPARDSAWVWLISENGAPETRIASLPGNDVLIAASDRFIGEMAPPFGRITTVRFHDGALWVGTGDDFTINRLDLQGHLRASIRWERGPELLAPEEGQAALDSLKRGFSAGRFEEMIERPFREALDHIKLPDAKPAYRTFRLADDGTLWVERFVTEQHTGPTSWAVFATDGHLLGEVALPPGFTPTQIGTDELLGLWKDPDGVDRVVAYGLARDSMP